MNAQNVIDRNNVQVLGRPEGPPLVLVQGFGCDQVIWDRMLPAFTDKYKVILFDHVGTGGADPAAYDRAKYSTLDGYVNDLQEVMDVLDLQDATVLGHSIAGAMALTLARSNPRIGRLILLCTSARYLNDGSYTGGLEPQDVESVLAAAELNYPLWAASAAPELTGTPSGSPVSAELTERLCRLNPEYVRDFLHMSFHTDIRHLLPQVMTPALILQTAADPLVPSAASDYLHTHLPASTFKLLDTYGSMPHLGSPAITAAAVLTYLSQVSRG